MSDAGDLFVAVERAAVDVLGSVAGADPAWLLLGVVLHVANQAARGRGWYAILAGACDERAGLRRRDALAVWVAGAGAGGVLSARGGDAVPVLLLSRRLRGGGCPVVAGTVVAEGAGDAAIGAVVIVLAVAFGVWPGLGLSIGAWWPWLLAAIAPAALTSAVVRRRGPAPPGRRPRRLIAGLRRGCAPLAAPGAFCATVLPWQLASRVLRAAALACFLLTWMLSGPVFAIFPVAPPRLAGMGMLDTISQSTGLALDSRFATVLYNPLAAVPSLHAGFAFAVSVALVVALRRPAARWLAAAWTPIVGLSVVATGNHYLFDIAAGIAITLLGGLVALRMRREVPAPRRPSTVLA